MILVETQITAVNYRRSYEMATKELNWKSNNSFFKLLNHSSEPVSRRSNTALFIYKVPRYRVVGHTLGASLYIAKHLQFHTVMQRSFDDIIVQSMYLAEVYEVGSYLKQIVGYFLFCVVL